jgi:hypothetical protein
MSEMVPSHPNSDAIAYFRELFEHRDSAIVLPRKELVGSNWQPSPHKCHYNVDTYCRNFPDHFPVRGWQFIDYRDTTPFVTFIRHSVLKQPNGCVIDITPIEADGLRQRVSSQIPFIQVSESDELFGSREEFTESGRFDFRYPPSN